MNCANHPDRERAAFCQNCGKPLCAECVRNVGASVFCEPCLAARVAGSTPPVGYGQQGRAGYSASYPPVPPQGRSEPNPALAALLGFIPGVGAMYNEQYAKGIVHLVVFAVLVSLSHDGGFSDMFGLFVAGWVFYMVIEAYHTARARRDGTPLPNPFGLNEISERFGSGRTWPPGTGYGPGYSGNTPGSGPTHPGPGAAGPGAAGPGAAGPDAAGASSAGAPSSGAYAPPYSYPYVPPATHWGAPQDAYSAVPPVTPVPPMPVYPDPSLPYYRRFPSGAIWLIVLGVFFLVGNTGIFHIFHTHLFGPFLLIGIGAWLFVHQMTSTGRGLENDGTPDYRWRLASAVNSSAWVALTGMVWLLNSLQILSWSHSWPIYLIAVGLLSIFKRTMCGEYGSYSPPPAQPPAAAPVTTTDLVPSPPSPESPSDRQEGR
jgi:hypothetical protein